MIQLVGLHLGSSDRQTTRYKDQIIKSELMGPFLTPSLKSSVSQDHTWNSEFTMHKQKPRKWQLKTLKPKQKHTDQKTIIHSTFVWSSPQDGMTNSKQGKNNRTEQGKKKIKRC